MAAAATCAPVAEGRRPGRSPSPMSRPQTAAADASNGKMRPSNCRAKSCSIHLSNRSRWACSLTFRAPLTSSPMVCAASKKEVARFLCLDPVEDGLVRSWPDGLADHIRVQENGHQARSADRPVEWSRSTVNSASVKGEARKKATNSAPVLALGAVSLGCRDRRISSAASPPECGAPAMALTTGASCKGTVTSTRLAPPVAILLR